MPSKSLMNSWYTDQYLEHARNRRWMQLYLHQCTTKLQRALDFVVGAFKHGVRDARKGAAVCAYKVIDHTCGCRAEGMESLRQYGNSNSVGHIHALWKSSVKKCSEIFATIDISGGQK